MADLFSETILKGVNMNDLMSQLKDVLVKTGKKAAVMFIDALLAAIPNLDLGAFNAFKTTIVMILTPILEAVKKYFADEPVVPVLTGPLRF